jgi:transposase
VNEQFEQRKVEPNSGLGQAITYMLKRWEPLTRFLEVPGAPLDNNVSNAARGIRNVMPTAGLCRVAA